MTYPDKVAISTKYIRSIIGDKISIEAALILGSGLGIMADEIENSILIPYEEIPHFPISTVEGHKGQFVIGTLEKQTVIAMQGRFHYYEGYDMQTVTFPVRVFQALGIKQMIVTNASGGVNENFNPGNLMIIRDHINFAFDNPLFGKNFDQWGVRFPDTSTLYKPSLVKIAQEAGQSLGLDLKEGVYLFNTGPCYETPAEVRMARIIGADAVGMSTVPEGIAAAHAGIDVLGISLITNMAAGILDQPLNHKEVVETADRVKKEFIALVREILKRIG
jgi:purine-nucleoside phosphorylase